MPVEKNPELTELRLVAWAVIPLMRLHQQMTYREIYEALCAKFGWNFSLGSFTKVLVKEESKLHITFHPYPGESNQQYFSGAEGIYHVFDTRIARGFVYIVRTDSDVPFLN